MAIATRQTSVAQAYEVLQSAHRPDYLVFVNEQSIAPQILRMAQGHGVKLFIVNNTLTADQGERFGEAPDLLGSLVQNDEQAGYLMLKELVRQLPARRAGSDARKTQRGHAGGKWTEDFAGRLRGQSLRLGSPA